jgi:DNA-directed RNA polymerase specialized sigma24 family protein
MSGVWRGESPASPTNSAASSVATPTSEELAPLVDSTPKLVEQVRVASERGVSRDFRDVGRADPLPSLCRHELQRAIAQLSPRQRSVIAMRFFEDQTLLRIAERLGVTESRACQLVREAVAELREKLGLEEAQSD